MGWRETGRGWARRSGWARNGGIPGPGEGRLSVLLPGEGKEEAVVVVVVACSRRQRRKTGTRGKKTSQCRSNGYLDCCIEAVMQEMEGRSGNPVTKSGLSLGRPAKGLGAGWAGLGEVAARELALAWCCGTRGVEQPMSSVEAVYKEPDLSRGGGGGRQVEIRGRAGKRWAQWRRERVCR